MNTKIIKVGAIAIVSVLVLGTAAVKLRPNNDISTSAPRFLTAEVQRGNIQVAASGRGSIAASVRKEVMTLTSGNVDKIYVSEGQSVNEGDLIVTFESDTENSVIERAKLDVTIAENNLKELQQDLKNLTVYAPVSGVLGDIRVSEGEEVSKGYTLTTITDNSTMEIIGRFNKSQINQIAVGDKAEVLLLDSIQTIEGTVSKVSDAPESNYEGAILYDVTLEINNPGGLTEGMKTQVSVAGESGELKAVASSGVQAKAPYSFKLPSGGTVTSMLATSGNYVEKGELLMELENNNLEIQIVTQEIKLEQSRLALSEKLKERDSTAVYAPISGRITEVNVTEGESVRENTAVAVVSDLEKLEVVIPVDELDINKIKVGQAATVTVEAVPDTRFTAVVSQVALEGNSSGGVATFDVTLSLKDIAGLKPGMTANVEIVAARKENVLLLPIEAVQQRGNNRAVITSIEQDAQGQTATTPIKIGLVSADFVEITDGLNEGDTVYYVPAAGSSAGNQRFGPAMMGGMGGRASGGGRASFGGGR